MLIFDSKGYLTPYNAIPSTVDEMRKYFVEDIPSESRKEIFDKYIRYSDDLKKLLGAMPLKQWVNGSFVTKVRNPNDIDLVTFINHDLIRKQEGKINIFRSQGSWRNYGVDAYIIEVFPAKSKKYHITDFDSRDWLNLFTNNRTDRYGRQTKKGFLEIMY